MRISPTLLDELVAHALEDPANEVCGVIAVTAGERGAARDDGGVGGRVTRAPARARAARQQSLREPAALRDRAKGAAALSNACEEVGELGAIYHSHVRSAPYPSQTDINFAANWPGVEWVIVGLAADAEPEVRSYLIENGQVREVALEVR